MKEPTSSWRLIVRLCSASMRSPIGELCDKLYDKTTRSLLRRTAHDCQISLHRATFKCRFDNIRERSLCRKQRLFGARSTPAAGETERITKLCSVLQLWKTQLEHFANDEPQ